MRLSNIKYEKKITNTKTKRHRLNVTEYFKCSHQNSSHFKFSINRLQKKKFLSYIFFVRKLLR